MIRQTQQRGFTLIEVILVVAMVTLIVTLLTWTVSGNFMRAKLDQGADQFETLLRMLRAESSITGRRFRIVFESPSVEDGEEGGDAVEDLWIKVMWEAQPLAQPGEFLPYANSGWAQSLPNELVFVQRSVRNSSGPHRVEVFAAGSAEDPGEEDGGAGDGVHQSIDFFPDGSSESAEIHLISREAEDQRVVKIEWDGMIGQVLKQTYTPSEWDAYISSQD